MRRALILVPVLLAATLAGCVGTRLDAAGAAAGAAGGLACPDGQEVSACNRGLSGPGVNEFAVAANPTDPMNAIIVANDYGAPDATTKPFHRLWGSWWFTHDGGATWTKRVVPGMLPDATRSLAGYQFVGDLVVAYADDGTAWMAGIAYTAAGPVYRNAVWIASSRDGGATFSEPALVDSYATELIFHDKPALALDRAGRIYLVWSFQDVGQRGTPNDQGMRVGVSEDGAKTWRTGWISRNDFGISASIAIGPDGAVNVAWRSYDPYAHQFRRSTDHGRTWSDPVVARALDRMDLKLPNSSYRAFVLPTLVATPDGALLMITADKGKDQSSDVFLLRSNDDGATWNATVLPRATKNAQFLPTIAAAPDGRVVAAWLDRRDDAEDASYVLYAAESADGVAFTERVVGSAPSRDPNDGTAGSTFIGDYIGAAILGDRVYLAWPDLREDGRSRLFAAALVAGNPKA
ncbi:MAG TPA: sialidase family protein [Candidatus Thermoplasmatota archaeon]|nr:sialidase family protein [Candidatus Thermoplasmatota archaeon]